MITILIKLLSLILPADGPEAQAEVLPRGQPAGITDNHDVAEVPGDRAEIGPRMELLAII